MNFGVGYFPTDYGMAPGDVARLVEEYGQESLFFAEHTHIPASRATPHPSGRPLPRKYIHTLDVFVALIAAAAATSRLRVGSGICLVTERDPIVTAKAAASVDVLSGGRLEFGVGAGWNREELRNHGTDPRVRMAVMRERVEAIREIWTQREATYAGAHVAFEAIWSYPKPAQRPHPPILVGGEGATVLDRVLAFGDAWLPHYDHTERTFERMDELRARADRPIELQMIGLPAEAEALARCDAAGVRRVIRWLPSGGRGTVERELAAWDAAIADFTGD